MFLQFRNLQPKMKVIKHCKEKAFIYRHKKVLCIFAHPDDEAFACAGTIYKLKKSGSNINLICMTRGEAGSAGEPPICFPEELGEKRTAELKCSAKILGIKNIYFLGLRDGTLSKFSKNYLSSLLLPVLNRIKPNMILTYVSTGISGHSDHIAVSQAVTLSYKLFIKKQKTKSKLYYATLPDSLIAIMRQEGVIKEVFKNPFKGTPDLKIDFKIDIRKELRIKTNALKCHQTQHQDWERFLKRLPKGFQDYEYFVEDK